MKHLGLFSLVVMVLLGGCSKEENSSLFTAKKANALTDAVTESLSGAIEELKDLQVNLKGEVRVRSQWWSRNGGVTL